MIRAQRSTGLIALGFAVFFSTVPTHAQLIKRPTTAAPGSPSGLGPTSANTAVLAARSQPPTAQAQSVTLSEAVAIFLQQNFQLIAAHYDIDTAEAEKLT